MAAKKAKDDEAQEMEPVAMTVDPFYCEHLKAMLALEAAKENVLSSEEAALVIRKFLGLIEG